MIIPALINNDEHLLMTFILYNAHQGYFFITHTKMTTAKLKSMEKVLQEEVEKFRTLQKGIKE